MTVNIITKPTRDDQCHCHSDALCHFSSGYACEDPSPEDEKIPLGEKARLVPFSKPVYGNLKAGR